jgi:3-deoxy-D-manno-octulosonic acid kinase
MSSGIHSLSQQFENRYMIYDAELAGQISPGWFDPQYWQTHGELSEVGRGRGRAWFITSDDRQFVLRHYRRGGLMAKITTDRYAWTGLQRTRAWREYYLLARLLELGLPAPRPLAAQVLRHGSFYTADLLTVRIPDSRPLSQILETQTLAAQQWRDIGKCIAAYHRHNIFHADLNAHNILLDRAGRVFLIDFDKGRVDQDHSWHLATLQRLERSLNKLSAQHAGLHFRNEDWAALLAGYESG